MKIGEFRKVVMHPELFKTKIVKNENTIFEDTFDKMSDRFDNEDAVPHIYQKEYTILLAVN